MYLKLLRQGLMHHKLPAGATRSMACSPRMSLFQAAVEFSPCLKQGSCYREVTGLQNTFAYACTQVVGYSVTQTCPRVSPGPGVEDKGLF